MSTSRIKGTDPFNFVLANGQSYTFSVYQGAYLITVTENNYSAIATDLYICSNIFGTYINLTRITNNASHVTLTPGTATDHDITLTVSTTAASGTLVSVIHS